VRQLCIVRSGRQKNITAVRDAVTAVRRPRTRGRSRARDAQKLFGARAILVSMRTLFQQTSPPAGGTPGSRELDPSLLLQTPSPRVVKMGWSIKLQFVAFVFFFVIFAIWMSDPNRVPKSGSVAGMIVPILVLFILVSIVSTIVVRDLRDLRLLQNGNCVMGLVVDRIRVGGGKQRRTQIIYQFAVGPGKPMTARGDDDTNSCLIGFRVLVFFDPNGYERNVALCSTGWRVYDEQGRMIEP
jgi:hypothetical protein